MNNYVVIAVDGPSCSGKSTIARNLARSLGFVHVNSGALFRGVALLAIRLKLPLDGTVTEMGFDGSIGEFPKKQGEVPLAVDLDLLKIADALAELARSISFEFKTEPGHINLPKNAEDGSSAGRDTSGCNTVVLINGVDEGENLYTPEVSQGASRVAVYSQVRDVLTEVQREAAKKAPLVLEGRDAGTVVFPNTPYKYYLDAALEVRAQRRLEQLRASGLSVSGLEEVAAEMRERDERDMKREITPLRRAADAKIIDTSTLTEEEVVERIKMDVLSPSS